MRSGAADAQEGTTSTRPFYCVCALSACLHLPTFPLVCCLRFSAGEWSAPTFKSKARREKSGDTGAARRSVHASELTAFARRDHVYTGVVPWNLIDGRGDHRRQQPQLPDGAVPLATKSAAGAASTLVARGSTIYPVPPALRRLYFGTWVDANDDAAGHHFVGKLVRRRHSTHVGLVVAHDHVTDCYNIHFDAVHHSMASH